MRSLIPEDVIFSLQNAYAEGLLSGTKCVELRRRVPSLDCGTRVWMYSKIPTGEVVGIGLLSEVAIGRPDELWSEYSQCSGLAESEFFRYFDGVERGAALVFSSVARLINPISLSTLKTLVPGFQPPQFFSRVKSATLRRTLRAAETTAPHDPCGH
jgi:predicted transcriptional regulator